MTKMGCILYVALIMIWFSFVNNSYTCDICLILAALVVPYISVVELLLWCWCDGTAFGSVLLPPRLEFWGITMPIPSRALIDGFGGTFGGTFLPRLCDLEAVP